jgi:hypothetical protein
MTQADYCRHSGLSRGQVCKLVKRGMPLTSPEAADAWRGSSARKQPKNASQQTSGPFRPPEAAEPDNVSAAEDTPQGAYVRQKNIERAAYALAARALRNGQPDAGRLVAVHGQASRELRQAKLEILEISEREMQLVRGDWVKKAMLDHDGAVAQLLKAMPKQLAGRIAPHDPEHAENELNRWVQEVALATLYSTNPWK